jgi:hypothetical protein
LTIAVVLANVRAQGQDAKLSNSIRAEYTVLSTQYAKAAPGWRPKAPATGSLLFVAPDQYSPAERENGSIRKARNEYAEKLFALAKQAAEAGQLSSAFQWATETLRENPQHADARRVLGYEKHGEDSLTPYGVRMAEAGKSWHPKYGWLAAADVARYEAGERLAGKRWISVGEDAERHRDMKHGWQVRTDHFLVTTNHSLEAAAELAARLERLHQIWRQLFAGFYLTENEVRRLFAGERQPRKQVRPFRVYYYRDREEYNDALRRRQPRIADTLGIYFDEQREAHFFAADVAAAASAAPGATGGPAVATLNHEAVHQLFQESKPSVKRVGLLVNFWIVEGIATYFETLREHRDPTAGLYFTIGEWDAGRLPAARLRLTEGYYVPFAELAAMGMRDVQTDREIMKLYSQATGMSAFLMDADEERYREALVRYLAAVYAGRDSNGTLAEEADANYSDLDREYRRYLESLP